MEITVLHHNYLYLGWKMVPVVLHTLNRINITNCLVYSLIVFKQFGETLKNNIPSNKKHI